MFFSKLDKQIIKKYQPDWLLGCDEVGRGCLAGPVVAACAGINLDKFDISFFKSCGINDSKQLSAKKRNELIKYLDISWDFKKETQNVFNSHGVIINISQLSAQVVDERNIFYASLMAMDNSLSLMRKKIKNPYLLIDGKWDLSKVSKMKVKQEAIIKGDSLSKVIGLSSIVAKEFRDAMMRDLYAKKHPLFHFEKNMGYPTKLHKKAIIEHGILAIHRKTFKGVKEYVTKKD
jgi:ribonuclease HII